MGNAIVFPLDLATTRLQHAPKRSTAQKRVFVPHLAEVLTDQLSLPHPNPSKADQPSGIHTPLFGSQSGYPLDSSLQLPLLLLLHLAAQDRSPKTARTNVPLCWKARRSGRHGRAPHRRRGRYRFEGYHFTHLSSLRSTTDKRR